MLYSCYIAKHRSWCRTRKFAAPAPLGRSAPGNSEALRLDVSFGKTSRKLASLTAPRSPPYPRPPLPRHRHRVPRRPLAWGNDHVSGTGVCEKNVHRPCGCTLAAGNPVPRISMLPDVGATPPSKMNVFFATGSTRGEGVANIDIWGAGGRTLMWSLGG